MVRRLRGKKMKIPFTDSLPHGFTVARSSAVAALERSDKVAIELLRGDHAFAALKRGYASVMR